MNYQNQSFENRISSDGFDFRNDKSDILMHKLKKLFSSILCIFQDSSISVASSLCLKNLENLLQKKVMKKPCPT